MFLSHAFFESTPKTNLLQETSCVRSLFQFCMKKKFFGAWGISIALGIIASLGYFGKIPSAIGGMSTVLALTIGLPPILRLLYSCRNKCHFSFKQKPQVQHRSVDAELERKYFTPRGTCFVLSGDLITQK